MTPPDIGFTLKPLTPADLPAVAAIHLAAFTDSALTSLGRQAVQRYYRWQLLGPHDVVAIGAYRNAELVGFCFGGIFRGALSGFLHKNRAYLAWRVLTHPWLMTNSLFRERLETGLRALRRRPPNKPSPKPPTLNPASFGILSIAVHPDHQGQGVGQALMQEAERAAMARDFQRMHLTVSPANHQAIRFYERSGWEKVPNDSHWKGTMHKRLVRDLL